MLNYVNMWRVILEWCNQHGKTSATDFKEQDFWALKAWLQERGDGASTEYHRLIQLKTAFKWALREKRIAKNPVARPKLSKPSHPGQPCFTAEQISTRSCALTWKTSPARRNCV
jgi:site-specific recombinase XerD